MSARLVARSVKADDLDTSRCPGCGADAGPEGVHMAGHTPIEWGRVALRYYICSVCGLGDKDNLIQMSFWMSGNPAAVRLMDIYQELVEQLGEEAA